MVTKSHRNSREKEMIDRWIDHLQKYPTDDVVQEKIIHAYRGLIESLARKYSKNASIHEDLTQVGMIGLLEAVRRYDQAFGEPIECFAVSTIIAEMKRYMRGTTWDVQVARRVKEMGPKIKTAIDVLTAQNHRAPTIQEIADYLHVTEEDVLETMEMGQNYQTLSADRKIEADADGRTVSIFDLVGSNERGYTIIDFRLLLEKIIPALSEREQQIIQHTYFDNMSQKETGEWLGISQMHVSRLQRRSLRKLRALIQSDRSEVFD